MEDFCNHHMLWLKQYFLLPNGIPSHDTFYRVFAAIDPDAFQTSFLDWIKEVICLLPENVIPIDGKSICASRRDKFNFKALHIVSAFSCAKGISLGQIIVDDKSNEITAIPELLKQLCIQGAIVTIDAMGCQKNIAKQIIEQDADYILRVKANQAELHSALESTFISMEKINYSNRVHYIADDQINNDHDRIESRKCFVLPMMYLMLSTKLKWHGLKSLVLIISERESHLHKTTEYRYYISSFEPSQPQRILSSIRHHWQIENNLHWLLDVAYKEDQCRIREQNTALNMAWLRKTALALLKRAEHIKGSIRRKQLAIWAKPDYLLDIVQI